MKKGFGIKEVVAMGIGTALFVVLTNVQIPLVVVPNTALQPRMAILAFFSAIFGPIVGAVIGLLGHALGDAIFYGSVWWSWVFPEAVIGIAIGFFANRFAVREGGFTAKNIVMFNIVQIVANAIAWIGVAPLLDILVYSEPANKVFAQGAFAFLGNILVIGILGTILLSVYSKISGRSSDLKTEE
ncbi:MAG: ECF-type riboflavin transporter substrate-binding protein [Lachnospiraceae bacterium]|nr:ECF-type riboflavin transporter substrate-binding protein [Lachnospiraceae bacterium]